MNFDSVYQEQAQIAKAWVEFVSKGTLPQDVRLMIAQGKISRTVKRRMGYGNC